MLSLCSWIFLLLILNWCY